jgi:CO/xanthine dehydrogenase FAD-binding subunit
MKPVAFDYYRAESVEDAVAALGRGGGDGKIIAGGQSLMPMMNFRLVKPSILVDINRIPGLDRVEDRGQRLHLGALVRHRMTASDPVIAHAIPILHETMKNVAHLTVRNRGTFCGSVCHADPAAEMPMMTLLLNGIVHIAGPAGAHTMPAEAFFVASLTPALEPDEMVTGVELDKLDRRTGWGFEEFARRHGDYALAAVAVTMDRQGGRARNVRAALMGVNEMSSRLSHVEAALEGSSVGEADIDAAVAALREQATPNTDLNGSADYRCYLAGTLAKRVIKGAWSRAVEREAA